MSPKNTQNVPLFDIRISAAEKRAVVETLSGGWLTTGPTCAKLERAICDLTGVKHACAVSSATAGLHLALQALNIGPGDEVVVPGFTFSATAAAVLYAGGAPVFADIDPETYNITAESVERALTRKTKAVIAVDYAGMPCNYVELERFCRRRMLKLICDAAHSLGAVHERKPVGRYGSATVFSFYATKNITAGEGGMVVTGSGALAERIRRLSLHGITKSTVARNRPGQWRYDIPELGHKYNLSDINASLALAQLKRFEERMIRRRRLAQFYNKKLARFADYLSTPPDGGDNGRVWHLYVIRLASGRWKISRDRFIQELAALGVGAGVHYIPVYRLRYFKRLGLNSAGRLPVTESVWRRVVTLPLYPELTNRQVDYVVESIGRLVGRFGR